MAILIRQIAGTDLRLEPGGFPLPPELRAQVPAVWARLRQGNPSIWDGRLYGFGQPNIGEDGVLSAPAWEDDYSAHVTWRDAGFPDIGLYHIFVTALICSSDGAILLGRMSANTLNAGRVYPPGGVLDPRDLTADGRIDAERAIGFELTEETGLDSATARKGALLCISEGPRLCICRALHFDVPAAELQREILATIARQPQPELDAIVVCRSVADGETSGQLVPYAAALIDAVFSGAIDL